VITVVIAGFAITAGSRNGVAGTNGSFSAVRISVGTVMRSMPRIALARW
jgi:hypothetical protein